MEMHLVHYKADFNNVTEAASENKDDSLAVLGIFFKVKKGLEGSGCTFI